MSICLPDVCAVQCELHDMCSARHIPYSHLRVCFSFIHHIVKGGVEVRHQITRQGCFCVNHSDIYIVIPSCREILWWQSWSIRLACDGAISRHWVRSDGFTSILKKLKGRRDLRIPFELRHASRLQFYASLTSLNKTESSHEAQS